MAGRFHTVVIDECAFPVSFRGFQEPMEVRVADGAVVEFLPWTCAQHLAALDRHLGAVAEGLQFDAKAFSQEILSASGVPGRVTEELMPLALWWAAGGEEKPPEAVADGTLPVGKARFRLRPWTSGERLQALAANLNSDANGTPVFRVAGYLMAMLRASATVLEPAGTPLEEMDSQTTAALIAAVVNLNVPKAWDEEVTARLAAGSQETAVNTLRLCRALGWTPSQVWNTPAPEVDRLLALLDHVAPHSPPAQRRAPGLADHPDAVIIHIEDDDQ